MRPALFALPLLFILSPVHAQEGPKGIAFVQAVEQGGGVALDYTPEAAFAAATEQCTAGGAMAEDCLKTNWCMPAGWSVDIFAQHQEGNHWHEVICGLPSLAAAKATALHACDKSERDWLIECSAVQFYDPEGNKQLPE